MNYEIVLMWVALTLYAAGSALFIVGVVFEREKVVSAALVVSALGLIPQLVSFGMRWVRLGHGPYLGFYEVTGSLTIFTVGMLVLLCWRYPKLAPVGVIVMPFSFLVLAGAMLASKGELHITSSLASYWLFIHVMFAKLGVGSFVMSFALATVFLLRAKSVKGRWAHHLEKLPSQDIVDYLSYRFAVAGFLFWGVMIACGAIWANESWGRYWGWDPIETWSLIVWLIYAGYLHLRLTMGWRGERASWYSVAAMPIALFTLVGIPALFNSIHGAYLGG